MSEGSKLPECEHCGAELKGDEAFCPRCGASVAAAKPAAEGPRPPEQRMERREEYRRMRREGCFGGGGLWGAISGGVFLIGLGVLWYFDVWWPGILILIGIMIVVGGLVSYARR